jgi:hypothetical protein
MTKPFNKSKLEIVEKAFYVWHSSMIGYGYNLYKCIEEIEPVYAKTPGEAKSFPGVAAEYKMNNGEYPTFTDYKVRRAKRYDKVRYEDSVIPRHLAESRIDKEKVIYDRLNHINKFSDDTMFYVQRGYVGNAILFWGLNSSGYTCKLEKAQQYTKQEIINDFIKRPSNPNDRFIPATHIQEIATLMVDGQHLEGELII